jgi:cytochrome c oxidase assembly protein subunit 11
MTVVFYVDPEIVKDRDQDDLNTITLSYTFYRLRDEPRPVAETPDGTKSKL